MKKDILLYLHEEIMLQAMQAAVMVACIMPAIMASTIAVH
jgi:hypothetical protein